MAKLQGCGHELNNQGQLEKIRNYVKQFEAPSQNSAG